MKISYSIEAIKDLTRLRDFIALKNPSAASKVALLLKKGINQLKTFPQLGVAVALAPNPKMVRDLIVSNYIVRYLVLSNEINILRVWHQKENEKNI